MPWRDVFTRLHRRLSELGFGGGRRNGRGTPGIDAGYVMAALADEDLLHRTDWPGRTTWESMLLEEALYGTRIAGERFFTVAAEDQAGGRSTFDPGLALAILLALQLGFRGRYRGVEDAGAVQRLRLRLYELLCRQPWSPGAEWTASFAAADVSPLTEARVASLPPLKPWLTIAVAVLGLVLVPHVIWYSAVHDIVERGDQIVREGGQIVDGRE